MPLITRAYYKIAKDQLNRGKIEMKNALMLGGALVRGTQKWG